MPEVNSESNPQVTINRAQVQHIGNLARLQLTSEEETAFVEQLGSIFKYFDQLNQLDPELVDVEPTARAIPTINISRPDIANPFGDRELLLDGAPEREEDFFRVPQIMS
jgi:aspartyl-tRNA(Asn)/glutamyl-tRNA(Gln) amidotransferase subunit C